MTEQEKVFRELLELRIATSIPGAYKYRSPEYNQQRRRYWEARLEAAQEKDAAKYREYGYGLVDNDGAPVLEALCVDDDGKYLADDLVHKLNVELEILGVDDDGEIKHVGFKPPAPYQVVALYWNDEEPPK